MHVSQTQRNRTRRPATFVAVATVLAACVVLLALSGAAAAAPQSVLTLRTDGDHDGLWLLPPGGGEASAAGVLPGVAQQAAVSPDGATAAYLPAMGKPFVWIGHGPLAPKTISLQAAGIRTVTSMTWVSEDELLISGSKKANDADGYNDRLYTVDVKSGVVAAFRNLTGTQPDAAPDTGQIVYVQFKKLDDGSAKNDHTPKYRESLKLTTLTGSGSGRTLGSEEYRPLAYYRAWAAPQLAAGGKWIIAGELGSDVRVTYNIYYVDTDYWMQWLTTLQPTPMAMAWSPDSPAGRLRWGGDRSRFKHVVPLRLRRRRRHAAADRPGAHQQGFGLLGDGHRVVRRRSVRGRRGGSDREHRRRRAPRARDRRERHEQARSTSAWATSRSG